MTEPIVSVENLRVIYNQGKSNEVRSLDGVSVDIFPQEYVTIYGPSGCGKSTLLYAIAGLQTPTYGEVTISGKKISQMKPKDMVELHQTVIGLVFQAFYLIGSLSVIDNICLPMAFRGESPKARREKGMKLLQRFGIAEQAHKFPEQLSGGQKQRVAIARSLINDPEIILADEPVGNLDSESAKNVLQILKELNEVDKKTVILVTHNAEHLSFADRVIKMKDGKIVGEEVYKEKRPEAVVKEEIISEPVEISDELKILSRTFKSLTPKQVGVMLIPFKAKQLLAHILSELTEEQLGVAENYLKELLFRNINQSTFRERLDLPFEEGGANWNRLRADSFSQRVAMITGQAELMRGDTIAATQALGAYLKVMFKLNLSEELEKRFQMFLRMRIENKIDVLDLKKRLDTPKVLGGLGLYKNTVEKISREIEIIMLLRFSN